MALLFNLIISGLGLLTLIGLAIALAYVVYTAIRAYVKYTGKFKLCFCIILLVTPLWQIGASVLVMLTLAWFDSLKKQQTQQ